MGPGDQMSEYKIGDLLWLRPLDVNRYISFLGLNSLFGYTSTAKSREV